MSWSAHYPTCCGRAAIRSSFWSFRRRIRHLKRRILKRYCVPSKGITIIIRMRINKCECMCIKCTRIEGMLHHHHWLNSLAALSILHFNVLYVSLSLTLSFFCLCSWHLRFNARGNGSGRFRHRVLGWWTHSPRSLQALHHSLWLFSGLLSTHFHHHFQWPECTPPRLELKSFGRTDSPIIHQLLMI